MKEKHLSIGEERLLHLRKAEIALASVDWELCLRHLDNFLLSIDENKTPEIAKKITETFVLIDKTKMKNLVILRKSIEQQGFLEQHENIIRGELTIRQNTALAKLDCCWHLCMTEGLFHG